jgi:hypothetical protein
VHDALDVLDQAQSDGCACLDPLLLRRVDPLILVRRPAPRSRPDADGRRRYHGRTAVARDPEAASEAAFCIFDPPP